jgi:DNA-binding IclR family transcriptional regulator
MIRSVVKAIEILRILSDADGRSVTLDEISRRTGYNKSTVAHLLETLVAENMAEHLSRKEGYSIGYGAFMLSRFGGFNHRLKEIAHPVLKWLSATSGQTVLFFVLRGDKRICIDSVRGEFKAESDSDSLRVYSLPRSSTGEVLLANLSDYSKKLLFDEFEELASEMQNDGDALELRLAEIKRLGYGENSSVSDGIELRSFAAPVFKDKECIGAVGIPYYGAREEKHLKHLLKATREISRRLEFSVDSGV